MNEREEEMSNNKENKIEVVNDSKYNFISGWLVIPAIHVIITLIGSLVIVLIANPSELDQTGTITYIYSAISVIYLAITAYAWFKRKRFLPILMMVFYAFQAILSLFSFLDGYTLELFYMLINVVLIIYFIRSKRVKKAFVK